MNKEQLAAQLNGVTYPVRISKELREAAKAAGLVIVYGSSDDLMEFEGAIYDEVGVNDGGTALIDSGGLLPARENIRDDAELERFFVRRKSAEQIEAIWAPTETMSWTYKTNIPHATFDVIEDDYVYCRGVVFALSDVAAGEAKS